jgi:hypothetical protein
VAVAVEEVVIVALDVGLTVHTNDAESDGPGTAMVPPGSVVVVRWQGSKEKKVGVEAEMEVVVMLGVAALAVRM